MAEQPTDLSIVALFQLSLPLLLNSIFSPFWTKLCVLLQRVWSLQVPSWVECSCPFARESVKMEWTLQASGPLVIQLLPLWVTCFLSFEVINVQPLGGQRSWSFSRGQAASERWIGWPSSIPRWLVPFRINALLTLRRTLIALILLCDWSYSYWR